MSIVIEHVPTTLLSDLTPEQAWRFAKALPILLEVAAREETIYYGDFAPLIGAHPHLVNYYGIHSSVGWVLGHIARLERIGFPPLASLVILKETSEVADGYFIRHDVHGDPIISDPVEDRQKCYEWAAEGPRPR